MGRFTLVLLSALSLFAAESSTERLVKEVRHQLVMLPYYSVFDNLAYRVDGAKVTLFGQVVRPTLKGDAESNVKKIASSAESVGEWRLQWGD